MVSVGVVLYPELNPASDGRWADLETMGFPHAWCLDHLAWRKLAGSPWQATVPTLAAAALTTSTIRLGTFVATPNFRNPVPFAKELMTLDLMSGGRLNVGLGPGAPGFDASILGSPELSRKERMDRYVEFVTLLDLLLTQRWTSWSGTWFSAVDAPIIPGPAQHPRPPFIVAANGPRGMRLALQAGSGWVTMGSAPFGAPTDEWWAGLAEAAERFDALAASSPDVSPDFRRYLDLGAAQLDTDSVDALVEQIRRAGDLGFTDVVVPWPHDSGRGRQRLIAGLAERLDERGSLRDG